MPLISALLLGLAQGLTEFLPISSSGHLVLVGELLNFQSPGLVLETVVHVATTLVIIVYFRRRLLSILLGMFSDPAARRVTLMLALAFSVTVLLGLALNPLIADAFESPAFAGAMLLITGAVLVSVRFAPPGGEAGAMLNISWKVAIFIGLAQGLAIFPGLSRSGLTIAAGLWGGLGRSDAAEFSFLLAVPTLAAASLFALWQEPDLTGGDMSVMLVAAAVAFVSVLASVHWLMRWLRQGRLSWFAAYCVLVGGASLLVWGTGVL